MLSARPAEMGPEKTGESVEVGQASGPPQRRARARSLTLSETDEMASRASSQATDRCDRPPRASTAKLDALATQYTLLSRMDELKAEMQTMQTDIRQVLASVQAQTGTSIRTSGASQLGDRSPRLVQQQRSGLLRQTLSVPAGTPVWMRGHSKSASWHDVTPPPSDLSKGPSKSGSWHEVGQTQADTDANASHGPAAAALVEAAPSGNGNADATVALGTPRFMVKRSMSMQEIGKIGEISALMPSGWPKTVAPRRFLDRLAGNPDDNTKQLADMVRQVSIKTSSSHSHSSGTGSRIGFRQLQTMEEPTLLRSKSTVERLKGIRKKGIPTVHPHSKLRLAFDFASLSVLFYELIFIPYILSWPVSDDSGYVQASTFCTASYWLVDIVLSFFSGFYRVDDGEVEQRWKVIALRYLKTWFLVDVVAVLGDWINLVMTLVAHGEKGAAASRVLRIAKLGRFARLLGLMRLLRFIALLNQMLEAQMSEAWRLLARICQMSFFLLWFAHITACIWNAIGHIAVTDTAEVWIDTPMGFEGTRYTDFDLPYQYCTAYSWAMAQITLGAHDVNPVNTPERLFTVTVNIFGLIFGGTVVSVLSTTLIDFREINKQKKERIRTLRHFLHQHAVNLDVSSRVLGQVVVRAEHEAMLSIDDVDALRLLSSKLHSDLDYALFAPHLLTLPLLSSWEQMQSECVRHLCSNGMEYVSLLAEDELFHTGLSAQASYYMLHGSMKYTQERDQGGVCTVAVDVHKEKWLSEAALWTDWVHAGNAIADAPCNFISVQPDSIMVAVQKNHLIRNLTCRYGKMFHRCVQDATPFRLPTDLEVAHASFPELVSAMPLELRQLASLAFLELTVSKHGRSRLEKIFNLEMLEQSIRAGRIVVWLDRENELQEVVRKSVLRLESRLNGFKLVQMAERSPRNSSDWESTCALPSTTPGVQELPMNALRRMIKRRMPPLAGNLQICGMETSCSATQGSFPPMKAACFEATFQVYANDDVVSVLDSHSHCPPFLPAWCREIAAAAVSYYQGQHHVSVGAMEFDKLQDDAADFVAEPKIFIFPQGVFAWMPDTISSYLQVAEGRKHGNGFADQLNELEDEEEQEDEGNEAADSEESLVCEIPFEDGDSDDDVDQHGTGTRVVDVLDC